MKAFRVVTVTKDRANLDVQPGENMKEIFNSHLGTDEIVDVKDITHELKLDLYEIQLALQHYKVDELVQMLVLSILEKYDNISW